MPRLSRGGKWVFGWSVVGANRTICVPPEAGLEYGFAPGMDVYLVRGSRTSGGFSVARRESFPAQGLLRQRIVTVGTLEGNNRLHLPEEVDVMGGERLLAVRGSGLALGFLQRGPIHELALQHPEIGVFTA